jgi:ribonuclease P/MRP protein subunit RPP40
VRPHLELAAPSWSQWLAGAIEKIEKVQGKAVKIVTGLQSREYKERCSEFGLETTEDRRLGHDAVP